MVLQYANSLRRTLVLGISQDPHRLRHIRKAISSGEELEFEGMFEEREVELMRLGELFGPAPQLALVNPSPPSHRRTVTRNQKTPHTRATDAPSRGIKFPIS